MALRRAQVAVMVCVVARRALGLRRAPVVVARRSAGTKLGRQRVGASDEERRLREEPLIAKQWEYGEEPFSEEEAAAGGEAAGGFSLPDASDASDEAVAEAIRVLAPYVSEERKRAFVAVAGARTRRLSVAFERPSNPANAWACLRTLDAFGVQDVHVVKDSLEAAAARAAARGVDGGATDQHRSRHRKMHSAMGAQKWLTLREHESPEALVDSLHADGYAVAATDLGPGAVPLGDVDWADRKYALVFGNEETGISDDLRSKADVRVHLPMKGLAESLNLSVSVGACLSHVDARGGLAPDLSNEAKNRLLLKWYMLSVRAAEPLLRKFGVHLDDADLLKKRTTVLGYSTR